MVIEWQKQVLGAVPDRPVRSSSIAWVLQEETRCIASTLKALERKGLIECTKRGGRGLPAEWQRTDAGREYLDARKY